MSKINPIDWFNFYGSFEDIFIGLKNCNVISENKVSVYSNPSEINKPTFELINNQVKVIRENKFDFVIGATISKFMVLCAVKFKGEYFSAMSFVCFDLMKEEVPYIRVGTDYYKTIKKTDRYGAEQILIKHWTKDEIKQDHSKDLLNVILKFDDFTIVPNNKEFVKVIGNCYNLYSKFTHEPETKPVSINDIPTTITLLNHVFGEQLELGLKYFKILYEYPSQILPILSLVSTERETGKTTFLNWVQMIFGDNTVLIAPSDLNTNFNSGYATKNIIMIDETVIEKSHVVEKLKSLGTAKSISIQQKFVSQYSVPFFGKIILCTNKEEDFMRIDNEEIRFWVRKISLITGKKNTNIERDLFFEIPKFLKYLIDLPEIDFSNSRMVFTKEEILTSQLDVIKQESRSGLAKELELLIEDLFYNEGLKSFEATAIDIKNKWFAHNNQYSIAYIRKTLKNEFKLNPLKNKRYYPFGLVSPIEKVGTPFEFFNQNSQVFENQMNDKTSEIIF